jgi:hypothetical protein
MYNPTGREIEKKLSETYQNMWDYVTAGSAQFKRTGKGNPDKTVCREWISKQTFLEDIKLSGSLVLLARKVKDAGIEKPFEDGIIWFRTNGEEYNYEDCYWDAPQLKLIQPVLFTKEQSQGTLPYELNENKLDTLFEEEEIDKLDTIFGEGESVMLKLKFSPMQLLHLANNKTLDHTTRLRALKQLGTVQPVKVINNKWTFADTDDKIDALFNDEHLAGEQIVTEAITAPRRQVHQRSGANLVHNQLEQIDIVIHNAGMKGITRREIVRKTGYLPQIVSNRLAHMRVKKTAICEGRRLEAKWYKPHSFNKRW